ncbi:hypothetical protein BconGalA64_08800 [Burkholderia contaminans]|nr:hypothetical protein BconGalA64_08800 [Burkholderia contaminans]
MCVDMRGKVACDAVVGGDLGWWDAIGELLIVWLVWEFALVLGLTGVGGF